MHINFWIAPCVWLFGAYFLISLAKIWFYLLRDGYLMNNFLTMCFFWLYFPLNHSSNCDVLPSQAMFFLVSSMGCIFYQSFTSSLCSWLELLLHSSCWFPLFSKYVFTASLVFRRAMLLVCSSFVILKLFRWEEIN